jgi:hypothetical protein
MTEEIPTKSCTTCNTEHPATTEFFYADPKSRFGVSSKCKTCRNRQIKETRIQNDSEQRREEGRERSRKWGREHKEEKKAYDKKRVESGVSAELQRKYREEGLEGARKQAREWRRNNPEKIKELDRKYKEENPEQRAKTYKRHRLKKEYGMALEEHEATQIRQNFKCAICRKDIEDFSGKKIFHVDHDHFSGEVRGLLCPHCNSMVGFSEDSPETLLSAAEYLMNPPGYVKLDIGKAADKRTMEGKLLTNSEKPDTLKVGEENGD